jgi:predicted dehydrogenase
VVKNFNPVVPLINVKTGEISNPAHPRDTPDHYFVQGELESGAVASIAFRKAQKAVDDVGLRWFITGTKGELELTMPEDHYQQNPAGRSIRLRVGKEDVQEIPFEENVPEYIKAVPHPGASTAWLYEDYAEGSEGAVDFADSVKTHKLLDRILREGKYV